MKLSSFARVAGGLCAVMVAATIPVSSGSTAAAATSRDVRVGSFNITGVNADSGAKGDRRTWRERRGKVVSQIRGQRLDVVGVQEANQSTTYKKRLSFGENQYLDLRGALNRAGGSYALTNTKAYNCVKPRSTYNC